MSALSYLALGELAAPQFRQKARGTAIVEIQPGLSLDGGRWRHGQDGLRGNFPIPPDLDPIDDH